MAIGSPSNSISSCELSFLQCCFSLVGSLCLFLWLAVGSLGPNGLYYSVTHYQTTFESSYVDWARGWKDQKMDSFNYEIPFLTDLKKTPAYLLEIYK